MQLSCHRCRNCQLLKSAPCNQIRNAGNQIRLPERVMAANREYCCENLRSKSGSSVCTVPLFSETNNKEICALLQGQSIILSKLLRGIGIKLECAVSQENQRLVCKKCARKIVNCYKLYSEIHQVFVGGWTDEKFVQESSTFPQSPEIDWRRVHHQRSPTGVTPTAKRLKNQSSDRDAGEGQGPTANPLSKRSLFEDKRLDNYSPVGEEIERLMNIPAEVNLPPIVKVRLI